MVGSAGDGVELVDRIELELDLSPGIQGGGELRAVLGGSRQDGLALLLDIAGVIASLDAGLQGDAVCRSASRVAPGMAERAATELEDGVIAKDADQRRDVPDMDAPGRDR